MSIAGRQKSIIDAPVSPLLSIEGLTISFGEIAVVDEVDLTLAPGRMLALVGESGSGKTMVARAVLDLLPSGAVRQSGRISLMGEDLAALSPNSMQKVRGRKIGMIFQEPMASLNPALKVGYQLEEGLRLHYDISDDEIHERIIKMLVSVRIDDPESCLDRYPHQFSGGLRQRLMLASVMLLQPSLLLADEPTTALDNIVQKDVLDIIAGVTRDHGTSVIFITHDLSLVAEYADDVAVMHAGKIVEAGPVGDILRCSAHEYTRSLLAAVSRQEKARARGSESRAPLIEIQSLAVGYYGKRALLKPAQVTSAVTDVTLTINRGETLALVGESGSGKTSFGRALLGLVPKTAGTITYGGRDIHALNASDMRMQRRQMQLIFQDPWSSLDPRMRVDTIIGEGLRNVSELTKADRIEKVASILCDVDLAPEIASRYPHELSGGQRQRVCIARAVVMSPEFVVADEPVAALDATVQAQVLALLRRLKEQHGFTSLLISHDLGVVEEMADRVAVMYDGRIVELAPTATLFSTPLHPYTRRLLSAHPRLVPDGAGYALAARPLLPPAATSGLEVADWESTDSRWLKARLTAVADEHLLLCENSG